MYRYSNKDFYDLMRNCYFHPSRKYPSDAVKFIAELAMIYLWELGEIQVDGMRFDNASIRAFMVDEMTPEDLDRAIRVANFLGWKMRFFEFVEMLFRAVLYSDILTQMHFERTYGKSVRRFDFQAGERVGVFFASPNHIGRQSRPKKPVFTRLSALTELKCIWRLNLG